jgi:peptidoglycan lytic transglycosylase
MGLSVAMALSLPGAAVLGAERSGTPVANTAPAVANASTGIASWYGAQHQGRRTAGGELFQMERLTAAHRTLRLGTHVRVTNLENGRSVEVVINDRGPAVPGRLIDVSAGAATLLGMRARGLARVAVTPIVD